jgi:hypothetical protein
MHRNDDRELRAVNQPGGELVCDILIRSYARDFDWLRYCLASIARFARGFRRVILVVPESSAAQLAARGLSGGVTLVCPDYDVDYLGQQVTKLSADLFSDAAYICHVDSDCIFDRPLAPPDFFREGKVEIALTGYDRLPRGRTWQAATERALGYSLAHDFMRRQPHVYPRWLYAEVRERIREVHGVPAESYVLAQPPRGFSEFNALGAHAFARHRERFSWTPLEPDAPNQSLCRWYWSWGGLTPPIEREIAAILERTATALP